MVKLRTLIEAGQEIIEYAFYPDFNEHSLFFGKTGESYHTPYAGQVVSQLQPYRDHADVHSLIRWLVG